MEGLRSIPNYQRFDFDFAPSQPVLSLDVRGSIPSSELCALLHRCSNLERLVLQEVTLVSEPQLPGYRLTPQDLPKLAELKLAIKDKEDDPSIQDELALTNLPSLRSLDLACDHGEWDADEIPLVSFLRQATALRILRLSQCGHHTHEVLAAICAEVDIVPLLSELHLESYTKEIFKDNDYTGELEPLGDIVDILKPLTDTRWSLMLQASQSARVILSHSLPIERVDILRQLGVYVGLVDTLKSRLASPVDNTTGGSDDTSIIDQ
ncbi:hypothetical protein CALCODRAFT_64012 [Calocera cornea HHB12733]|uniref:F-box domain-containing protein n=1 Tax=Calocera cornea HHB12733 TaxID=1353952 RepID=A0A165DLN1_9BASI|nr:hypothetical protein CALCODRAFT_64012 [Calocera cornea HHB12733]